MQRFVAETRPVIKCTSEFLWWLCTSAGCRNISARAEECNRTNCILSGFLYPTLAENWVRISWIATLNISVKARFLTLPHCLGLPASQTLLSAVTQISGHWLAWRNLKSSSRYITAQFREAEPGQIDVSDSLVTVSSVWHVRPGTMFCTACWLQSLARSQLCKLARPHTEVRTGGTTWKGQMISEWSPDARGGR